MEKDTENLQKPVCKYCGSDRIIVDATMEWDPETQHWVVVDILDDLFCQDCEDETRVNWVEIDPPVPAAQVLGDIPTLREDAHRQIMESWGPYEGQRFADVPDNIRVRLILNWSRCADLLEKPARGVVRRCRDKDSPNFGHPVVDLSYYRQVQQAA